MKKIVLLVFATALAASPAMAKKANVKKETDPNEASWRLVKASAPLVLPSWALPIYFGMQKDEKQKDQKK